MSRTSRLAIAALLATGCGSSYKQLEVDKIKTVAVLPVTGVQTFCAYKPVALRAHVTYHDGEQLLSLAAGEKKKDRLKISEFAWSSSLGEVEGAVLSLPHTAVDWFHQPVRVGVAVSAKPELASETLLRPQFNCGGTLNFPGTDGARGGEAEDGGPGDPGPEVLVALAYVNSEASGRLVLVRVHPAGEPPEHYLVAPPGPGERFVIDARGGAGGRGGQGVAGYAGDNGAEGEPGAACSDGGPGQNGTDGLPGGNGGNGGNGGEGGLVHLQYDAAHPELTEVLDIRVAGGAAGSAGAGGRGGRGGAGGKGGKPGDPDPAYPGECGGVEGPSGARGVDAPDGTEGKPGIEGPPGEIRRNAANVSELFAEEIGRGIPVVVKQVEATADAQ